MFKKEIKGGWPGGGGGGWVVYRRRRGSNLLHTKNSKTCKNRL